MRSWWCLVHETAPFVTAPSAALLLHFSALSPLRPWLSAGLSIDIGPISTDIDPCLRDGRHGFGTAYRGAVEPTVASGPIPRLGHARTKARRSPRAASLAAPPPRA